MSLLNTIGFLTATCGLLACAQGTPSGTLSTKSVISLSSVDAFDKIQSNLLLVDIEAFRSGPTTDSIASALAAAQSSTLVMDGIALDGMETYMADHADSLDAFSIAYPTNGDFLDADSADADASPLSISEFRDAFEVLREVIADKSYGLTASPHFALDAYDDNFRSYECTRLKDANKACKNVLTALSNTKGDGTDAMTSCGAAFWRARLDPARKCEEALAAEQAAAKKANGSVTNECKNDTYQQDAKCRQFGNIGGNLVIKG